MAQQARPSLHRSVAPSPKGSDSYRLDRKVSTRYIHSGLLIIFFVKMMLRKINCYYFTICFKKGLIYDKNILEIFCTTFPFFWPIVEQIEGGSMVHAECSHIKKCIYMFLKHSKVGFIQKSVILIVF